MLVGLVDDNLKVGEIVLGIPVIGNTNDIENIFSLGYKNYIIAFGVLENRTKRFELYIKLKKIGCEFPNIVHPNALVEESVIIGEGNVILAGANIGSCVTIGNLNYINNNSLISHDCVLENNIHIAPAAVLASSIYIKSNALIGMNTTLYFGIKIGLNSTILNGLIVNNDVEDGIILKSNN
jgi:sugar O-acyltransferase (sialic acid O-acetyltransferase NeuD family)